MTYDLIVDPDTATRLTAGGGVVSVAKDDPRQRDLWLRLARLAYVGVVEEVDNTIATATYRLARNEGAR